MATVSAEDAVIKIILVQKQLIGEIHDLRRCLYTAIHVMEGLDHEFGYIFHARRLAFNPDDLPERIPSREMLQEALANLGWTPDKDLGLYLWGSWTGDPWKES